MAIADVHCLVRQGYRATIEDHRQLANAHPSRYVETWPIATHRTERMPKAREDGASGIGQSLLMPHAQHSANDENT